MVFFIHNHRFFALGPQRPTLYEPPWAVFKLFVHIVDRYSKAFLFCAVYLEQDLKLAHRFSVACDRICVLCVRCNHFAFVLLSWSCHSVKSFFFNLKKLFFAWLNKGSIELELLLTVLHLPTVDHDIEPSEHVFSSPSLQDKMGFDEVSRETVSVHLLFISFSHFLFWMHRLLHAVHVCLQTKRSSSLNLSPKYSDLPDQPEASTGQKDQDAENVRSSGSPSDPERCRGRQVRCTN